MNLDLAQMYGTPGAEEAAVEEHEKTAQAELFAKLAAGEGIDLNQLSDEQVQELWNGTFGKTASDKEDDDDEEEEEDKKAAAQAEYAAMQEGQNKVAEADYLGRVMAHSYVNELGQIGEHMDKAAGADRTEEFEKEAVSKVELGMRARDLASRAGKGAKSVGKSLRSAATGEKYRLGKAKAKNLGSAETKTMLGRRAMKSAPKGKREAFVRRAEGIIGQGAKNEMRRGAMETGALYGGGAAALGGGAYAAGKKKESSALDEMALHLAFEKGAAAGFEPQELEQRLLAVETLGGLEASEKVAAAENFDDALDTRALEYLDVAGYPVEWE